MKGFRFQPEDTNRALAFSTNVLASLVAQYIGNQLDDIELEAARRRITEHYLKNGYINSGALLPDQDLREGIVTFLIVEGRLTEVYVHGANRLKPRYLQRRIELGSKPPLNLDRLADSVDIIRRNPNVRSVVADLQPVKKEGAVVLGQSVLDLRVEEASPYHVDLVLDNYRPASIGAGELLIVASDQNLTGHSDPLELQYGLLEETKDHGAEFSGLDNINVSYSIPVTVRDTTIGGFYERRSYAVIEQPFSELNIDSSYEGYGFRMSQPLFRGGGHSLGVGLSFEHRRSEGFLLGQPFSFTPGTVGGVSEDTVLRFNVDWNRSWTNQNLALRLTVSWGLDALGATSLPSGPDGQFVAVLGQWQYAWRLLPESNSGLCAGTQFVFRGGFQWTDDPLISMEQLSLGGPGTVRGYRVNQVVRDTGVFGTVEVQIPIIRSKHNVMSLSAAPFFDAGAGWNVESSNQGLNNLSSVGVGLNLNVTRRVSARLDWGYPLRDPHNPHTDLQDLGLFFRIGCTIF